jgi:4-hydroxy-tetrahydrodipicolinate reductase
VNSDRLVSVVIVGARGRMGQTLIRTVLDSENLTLAGAVARSRAPGLGEDVGALVGMPDLGVVLTDTLQPPRGSIVVDFSLPEATNDNISRCRERRVPLVLGTTGIDPSTRALLKEAAAEIPIVSAANFSVGITLLTRLASLATRALGPDWETEIFELHHRHKRDAPSGTALRLGKTIADAAGRSLEDVGVTARDTQEGPRAPEEIGIMALRGGDSIGEHTVMFLGLGERIELVHRATDRAIFARGALRAARWVADREPGLYDMADVLGLSALTH